MSWGVKTTNENSSRTLIFAIPILMTFVAFQVGLLIHSKMPDRPALHGTPSFVPSLPKAPTKRTEWDQTHNQQFWFVPILQAKDSCDCDAGDAHQSPEKSFNLTHHVLRCVACAFSRPAG